MSSARGSRRAAEVADNADNDIASRLVQIMATGSERLLALQAEGVAVAIKEQVERLNTPLSAARAIETMWRLPGLYGNLFDHMTQHVRLSYRIMSDMQNELVDLACDSVAAQGPLIEGVLTGGAAAFGDRRQTSVVINFPDRRGMIARSRHAG